MSPRAARHNPTSRRVFGWKGDSPVKNRRALVILLAAAGASAGCADPAPSERVPSPTSSPAPSDVTPFESPSPEPESSAPREATALPSTEPPYRIVLSGASLPQEPRTIIFGSLPGPVSDALLEPFLVWPDGGLTIDAEVAFGAFWGGPLGASQIGITLYRMESGTLDLVWSDTKPVDVDATGYLDELVPFERPGTYRLEVTHGSTLLAWGVAFMGPPCEGNCSGG